jgi:hypothetical protein
MICSSKRCGRNFPYNEFSDISIYVIPIIELILINSNSIAKLYNQKEPHIINLKNKIKCSSHFGLELVLMRQAIMDLHKTNEYRQLMYGSDWLYA